MIHIVRTVMHAGLIGLLSPMLGTGGPGNIEPWHLEYIAMAGLIVAGTVGLVTIWKNAANDSIRRLASLVVVAVVGAGVFLAIGPKSGHLAEIREWIAQILPRDASISKGSGPHSLFSGSGGPSIFSGSGGPPATPTNSERAGGDPPYYQQSNPNFYRQSNPSQDTPPGDNPPSPNRSPSAQTRQSPTLTADSGGSVSNPYGGSVTNLTPTPTPN
jgi:hypothetical protein